MDTQKTGRFLKELRRESGMTQEQLGERIGVTNKTVSRWETGNYMPPVDCLVMMADIYGVSINEIVAGERVTKEDFEQKADDNLSQALRENEKTVKRAESILTVLMVIMTVTAMAVIILLPKQGMLTILLTVLVAVMAFIGNTVIVTALAMNKERSGK